MKQEKDKVKEKKEKDKIEDALMKVALGYQLAEVTEEYAEVDGELKLTKRKKTKKDIPPDLKAMQMLLLSKNGEEYALFSDEELEAEKTRLLALLSEEEKKNERSRCVTKSKSKTKTVKKTVKKSKSKKEGV